MALIQFQFMSEALMRTVPLEIILPIDSFSLSDPGQKATGPFKTLYLLHGVFGSQYDWLSGTNIQRWATEKKLAVVMPSGENMFYTDHPDAHNFYGQYIGEELPDIMTRTFPLSRDREDTFIAGLSMGGYGALRNGLKYHRTFGYIAGLSSALVTRFASERKSGGFFLDSKEYSEACFGPASQLMNSDNSVTYLARRLSESGEPFPKIYLTCGVDDSLLQVNREFRDFLRSIGAPLTYVEGPGAHEWDFWNRHIKKVLDWLPLSDASAGVNSGNVNG